MSFAPIIIVDDKDQQVGQASIAEALENGFTTRLARVMVVNKAGDKILLQKRVSSSRIYPGCWDNSAAGHVDVGESYLQAAKREMFEEIGIKTDDLDFVGKYHGHSESNGYILNQFNSVYKYESDETPENLQKSEVQLVKWFDINELKKQIKEKPELFTNGVVEVIDRFF